MILKYKFTNDVATDLYRKYFEGESYDRRYVNKAIADVAQLELEERYSTFDGRITTTRYNERVIFEYERERGNERLGSYAEDMDRVALNTEQYDKDEWIENMAQWIEGRGVSVVEELTS